MIVPPVIVRELRTAMRKHDPAKSRLKIGLIAAGLACLLMVLLPSHARPGRILHQYLFLFGLYLSVLPPVRLSVGLFCEERRNQTLELLYLTGMGPNELFFGKLLGGMMAAVTDLLALAPFLSLPFLMGGVSASLFSATLACFPIIFLFVISVGVLASTLTRDDGVALIWAISLTVILCLATAGPYMLGQIVANRAPFSTKWLCFSPAYGPYLIDHGLPARNLSEFWFNAGITLLWSLLLLAAASLAMRRAWRNDMSRIEPGGWMKKVQSWLHGSPEWRTALRARVLPLNAFQWLIEQDRYPAILSRALLGGVIVLWLLGWAMWPRAWPTPMNFFLTAFVLVLGTGVIFRYATGKQMAALRQDGGFELLLTTPLSPREIVAGQIAGLHSQFHSIRRLLVFVCLLMAAGGLLTRSWEARAAISYAAVWWFICGVALYQGRKGIPRYMWVALNTGRPFSAFMLLRSQAWGWYWILCYGRMIWDGLTHARGFPTGSVLEVILVLGGCTIGLIIVAVGDSEAQNIDHLLVTDMRELAQQPIPDPSDKCFKNWKGNTRLSPRG